MRKLLLSLIFSVLVICPLTAYGDSFSTNDNGVLFPYEGEGLYVIQGTGNGSSGSLASSDPIKEAKGQANALTSNAGAITANHSNKVEGLLSSGSAIESSYKVIESVTLKAGKNTYNGPLVYDSIKTWIDSVESHLIDVSIPAGSTKITFRMASKTVYWYDKSANDGKGGNVLIDRCDATNQGKYTDAQVKLQKELYKTYEAGLKHIESYCNAAKLGVFFGSFSKSYNVGQIYSEKQRTLSSVMAPITAEGFVDGYDFKSNSSLGASFDYFVNPFVGELHFDTTVPKSLEDWLNVLTEDNTKEAFDFIVGDTAHINSDYANFANSVNEANINSQGLKISKTFKIQGGITFPSGVSINGKEPKSVINYVMSIGYPRFFIKNGDTYSLKTSQLGTLGDYYFCVFNNKFYDSYGDLSSPVASLKDLGIERDQMVLYRTMVDGQPKAVVIPLSYNESIIDSSQNETRGNIYATGRKVVLGKSYSTKLKLDAESNNYFQVQSDVLSADKARKYFFGVPKELRDTLDQNELLWVPGDMISRGGIDGVTLSAIEDEEDEEGIKYIEYQDIESDTMDSISSELVDSNYHTELDLPEYIQLKVCAGEDATGHFGLYLIRNNYYSMDSKLVEFLQNNAPGYVEAGLLLARITGDFTNTLSKLSYSDWRAMQDIKAQIQHDKDTVAIRGFNIFRYVFGSLLILYAILIVLSGLFDSAGFLDLELLPKVTLGGAHYRPSDEVYAGKGYVDFNRLLIMGAGIALLGLLLLEGSELVYLGNWLFIKFSSLFN